jgi:hypothetical protein
MIRKVVWITLFPLELGPTTFFLVDWALFHQDGITIDAQAQAQKDQDENWPKFSVFESL